MPRVRTFLYCLTGIVVAGCATDASIQPGGCYDIAVGPWPESADYGSDTIAVAPPPRVRLDSMERDTIWRQIADIPGVMPSVHAIAVWRTAEPDSLEMVWSTGYVGVILRFAGHSEVLTGTAESFFDHHDGHTTSAEAVRVPCDAPIPEGMRAVRRYWPQVPLLSGDTIRMGDALPAGIGEPNPVPGRRILLERIPTGIYRGASTLVVQLDSNRYVTHIELSWPDTIAVDDLMAQLEAFYGPQTHAGSWMDRFHWISLQGSEDVRIRMVSQRAAWE